MASRGAADLATLGLTSTLPEVIEAKEVATPSGDFGYLRIRTFFSNIDNFVERFINEFIRLVEQLPHEGLIIDVRGNGGGFIFAGELLLQLLTPRRVTPEPAQFLNTALNLKLAQRHEFLTPWVSSIQQSVRSGAIYSRGFPIAP